ncbi:hypothetical protein DHEL01_v204800 [Diaporthe helianthi]|uniref:Uncharacterized protein n=1 Tax=Diaporthe helianthi TaxID=158607 RepID=A0A2P5I2Q3_DIAHE|nr:hypothetical protein DHEL01_v204800 [Diaporthe helianthi]
MPIVSIAEDHEDTAPDNVIPADVEINKPLLEASTGSTVIPMSGEKQVMMGARDLHSTKASRPCLSGHLCKAEGDLFDED